MKAITIQQPYAYAIVVGIKQYETRSRRTNIRGRVAIHAGKKVSSSFEKIVSKCYIGNIETGGKLAVDLGAVIGTVEIVDCVPVEAVLNTLTERERLLGDYTPGRFAWVLKNPVMFTTPFPAKGQQGWWKWDTVTIKKHSVMGKSEAIFEFVE